MSHKYIRNEDGVPMVAPESQPQQDGAIDPNYPLPPLPWRLAPITKGTTAKGLRIADARGETVSLKAVMVRLHDQGAALTQAREALEWMSRQRALTIFIENEDHVANFFEKCDAALGASQPVKGDK